MNADLLTKRVFEGKCSQDPMKLWLGAVIKQNRTILPELLEFQQT
jgi:hypothetical protein